MIVYAVMAAALVAVLVLAVLRKPGWAALLATIVALPLQVLGLTSTCTQGADGTFTTGALFSSPFLLIALGLVGWWMRTRESSVAAVPLVAVVSVLMLALTHQAWVGTLVYGTPCGEYFAMYPSGSVRGSLIVGAYLVLPLLLVAGAGYAALRDRLQPTGKSRP